MPMMQHIANRGGLIRSSVYTESFAVVKWSMPGSCWYSMTFREELSYTLWYEVSR
jgi:hypothetical protein